MTDETRNDLIHFIDGPLSGVFIHKDSPAARIVHCCDDIAVVFFLAAGSMGRYRPTGGRDEHGYPAWRHVPEAEYRELLFGPGEASRPASVPPMPGKGGSSCP